MTGTWNSRNPRLWDDTLTEAQRNGTQRTLLEVLEGLLRLAHPVIPYITETIWHQVIPQLSGSHETIMNQAYPAASDYLRDSEAETQVEWLKGVITGVRNIRGEANIKPNQEVTLLLQGGEHNEKELAAANESMLKRLANVASIAWLQEDEEPPPNALSLVGNLRVMVPLAGLIDVATEQARIEKDVDKAESELKRVAGKLSNENFTSKAPAEVVEKEREKAKGLEERISALTAQMEKLSDLA